jgi:hypothetical protein
MFFSQPCEKAADAGLVNRNGSLFQICETGLVAAAGL